MRLRQLGLWLAIGGVCASILSSGLGISAVASDSGFSANAGNSELERPFVPAISMSTDRRLAPAPGELSERFPAFGLVRCGAATGTGQLTLRTDVITTAAHVLIDQFGKRRIGCVFEPMGGEGSGPVPLDYASITTGSTTPLSQRATRDWAVARLVAPVSGAKAYALAAVPAVPAPVTMCAGGNRSDAIIGVERCSIRHVIGTAGDGIQEFAIDCNAGPGSSGAAIVSGDRILGIYVGYRSEAPQKAQAFSERHYNFAISVSGPFRRALLAAAAR